MQDQFSCLPAVFAKIEATLSAARLKRYLPAAGYDHQFALRIYVWNARICEQFVIPMQFVEISVRNRLNQALIGRFGPRWFQHPAFINQLPKRTKDDISKSIAENHSWHGADLNADHIISSLSFGFSVQITSAASTRSVWGGKLPGLFPHLKPGVSSAQIYSKLDQIRIFRNRIAHHNAIFDKRPLHEFRNIAEVTGWICPDTLWLVRQLSNVSGVINQRPRM